jgi:hypothetical protein
LFAQRPFVKYVGDDKLGLLGRALASEFTLGGATPLWTLLSSQLVEERSGPPPPLKPADAVVVVRTVKPQQGVTARFLDGLLGGLGVGGTPVIAVEKTAAQPSAVPAFTKRNIAIVDDIDQPVGRLALALLLNGAPTGHYGVKDKALAVLPPVVPVVSPAAGG